MITYFIAGKLHNTVIFEMMCITTVCSGHQSVTYGTEELFSNNNTLK